MFYWEESSIDVLFSEETESSDDVLLSDNASLFDDEESTGNLLTSAKVEF